MIAHFNRRRHLAGKVPRRRRAPMLAVRLAAAVSGVTVASAQALLATNVAAPPVVANSLRAVGAAPEAAATFFSLFRVLGALALVLAVFFGGLWLFRNWQRMLARKGQPAKLNILEAKSLGHRHALYLVGYEQQRLLIASSPTGITMLTALPEVSSQRSEVRGQTSDLCPPPSALCPPSFTAALCRALQPKSGR